jgi:predicted ferric reductase
LARPVDIEGPYGRFDIARINRRARQLWVAGGIGVTPFLAWLGSLQGGDGGRCRTADLHYCTLDRDNDPFVGELATLCAALPAIHLHVHGAQQGEKLDAATLLKDVPTGQPAEVWFCGPGGLAQALRGGLDKLGSRRLCFHQEAFQMR